MKFKHVTQRRIEIKEPLSQKVYFLYQQKNPKVHHSKKSRSKKL